MGTIVDMYTGWVAFATEDGTVNNSGAWLLLGGAVLVLLLAAYAAYNAVLATANGIRRTVRVGAAGFGRVVDLKPVPARAAAAIPTPRVAPVAVRKVVKVG